VLGGVLIADPFRSLAVLTLLVAAALAVSGVGELASAAASSRPWLSRLVGAVWIAGGVVAVAWPGLTIRALAVVVGIALLAGGAVKVVSAVAGHGDERFVQGLSGLTNGIVGILALSWPDVTVLALAVLFGIGVAVFGFGQVAVAFKLRGGTEKPWAERRRWPRAVRLVGAAAAFALALGGMAVSVAVERARPPEPGPFYTAPSPLPAGPPGSIIRSEVVDGYHPGATTYRVLYKSTGYDGEPTAVSGFVLVPEGEPAFAVRPVVAYTHGTTGVASNCAPSLQPDETNPLFFEGGDALLGAGYAIAASDYQGLGTPGPHPYLVGDSEAMNALDAVRAAQNLVEAKAGGDFVVWGHSQGGHAALFTGQLASTYAPELRLRGVAAGAPVPNLIELFEANIGTTVGKVLVSMALHSWAEVYDDADLNEVVAPAARPSVARIARHCLYSPREILASVPSALVLGLRFLSAPLWETEPWDRIAEENTPGQAETNAPILVVQGDDDHVVPSAVTSRLVDQLCADGETVVLRTYPGTPHLTTGNVAAPDVAAWIADRFEGKIAPTTCR
jgi:uncharacterized membrane protein HdeD (DUF308 family)/pimeloyl-ACP methyl ester carboxylesterase